MATTIDIDRNGVCFWMFPFVSHPSCLRLSWSYFSRNVVPREQASRNKPVKSVGIYQLAPPHIIYIQKYVTGREGLF